MSRNARVTNSSELLRGRKWVDGLNTFQNIVHAQCTWRVSFKNGGFLDLSSVECFGWASANKRPPRREKREFSQINMWSLKMPARLCQQWRIQGRTGDPPPPLFFLIFKPNWGPNGRKSFLRPLPYPYLRVWMTAPPLPPLICRSGSVIGRGPLLSGSSFAKGMKKSMNLRSFGKTKPLSASFPLKNFILTLSTNFTFFINSFVYLFGRLRRRELTHEHRNSQRVHLLQLITFSFFRVRRAKRETRKWPHAWLTARDARGTKTERLSFFFSGSRRRFARLVASPLPRACTALTKSEKKERLLAVYHS